MTDAGEISPKEGLSLATRPSRQQCKITVTSDLGRAEAASVTES